MKMRTAPIVRKNNQACVFIRHGRHESAITQLHKALLGLFRSHPRCQEPSCTKLLHLQHNDCFHNKNGVNGINFSNDDQETNSYFPENEYNEGMTAFSQPFHIIICDECDEDQYGTNDTSIEAAIFFNLGIAHTRIGDEQEALSYLTKSLKLQERTIASRFDVGVETTSKEFLNGPTIHKILHNIGHAHWKGARYTEAIETYSQALDHLLSKCPKLQHNQLDISATLNCIAVSMFYACERNTDDVLTIFERALALRIGSVPTAGYDRESATIINNCGRVRFICGEFVAAFKIYKEAYNQRVAVLGKDHKDVAASLFNMAQAKEHQGRFLEAIDLYKQFVDIPSVIKPGNGNTVVLDMTIAALTTIGQLSYDNGDLEQAQDSLSRALDLTKVTRTPRCDTVTKIFNILGHVFLCQGKVKLALEAFTSGLHAVVECDHIHNHLDPQHASLIVEDLVGIARIKHHQNDLDQCLDFYTEALAIVRSLNDQEGIARVLIALGTAYMEKKDIENATKTFSEAVTLLRENDRKIDASMLPYALNALGLMLHKKGSFTLALRSFLDAIKIYRTIEGGTPTLDVAAVYQNAATVYKEIGEGDKALHYYMSSLRLGEVQGQLADRSDFRCAYLNYEIGMIYKQREDFSKGLSHLNRSLQACMESALTTTKKADDIDSSDIGNLATRIFSGLADLHLQQGDVEMAMQSVVDATELSRASGLVMGSLNIFNNVGDFAYFSFMYQILRKTNPPAAAAA